MKSVTSIRKKHTNYPIEFKIKMVELSHKAGVSVARLARENGINDNLLFKWRQYWREGKLISPQQPDISMPALLPVTLDAEIEPAKQRPSPPAEQKTLPLSCEITFRNGTLRLEGSVSENLLAMLIQELKR
ncbi:TPA: transposase [Klebsiella michiganensis]|nr:transposase [Klebsiella michiganensis]